MEGSRHEKALLVTISYVIGFTAAFIAFGINVMQQTTPISQTATLQNSEPSSETSNQQFSSLSALETAEGLFVVNGEDKRLLSLNLRSADIKPEELTITNGYYYEVYGASVSPDGKYVYFCEQHDTSTNTCLPFIYEVASDTVHPVTFIGDNTELDTKIAQGVWNKNGTLTLGKFGEFTSRGSTEVWK